MTILGESGSGKSVTLKAMMRLLPERKSKISGSVVIDGHDILALDAGKLADVRGTAVSMIFQEPMLAFDPVFTIGEQIVETITRHEPVTQAAARTRANGVRPQPWGRLREGRRNGPDLGTHGLFHDVARAAGVRQEADTPRGRLFCGQATGTAAQPERAVLPDCGSHSPAGRCSTGT